MFSAILPSRRSTESTTSTASDRSLRCPTPSFVPPSISYGGPTRPNVELSKPVWEVSGTSQTVSVSGEIEVDVSMFRRGQHILPFSIGIHFTCATVPRSKTSSVSPPGYDSEDESFDYDTFRGEWNQDGPGNYYRHRSFIQIHPRLMVDDICYTKLTINVPTSLLPSAKDSRVFNVAVKAYELGNPFNVTEPSMARFMVLNQATQRPVTMDQKTRFSDFYDDGDDTDDSDSSQTDRHTPGCGRWKFKRSLSARIKRTSARYTFLF